MQCIKRYIAADLAAAFSAEECVQRICIVLTQCCLLNFCVMCTCIFRSILWINFHRLIPTPTVSLVLMQCYFSIFLSSICIVFSISYVYAGPDLNPIGPRTVKMWGGPPSHKFSDINAQKHSVDTCELYAILLLLFELRVETRLSAFESLM